MRLLVTTLDPTYGTFLQRALGAEGHLVELATGRAEAVGLVEAFDHDLVVIDSAPPKLDGLEALKSLRAAGGSPPVLLLIEGRHPEDRVRALDVGADDCLSKPCSFSELAARVRAVVRRHAPPPGPTQRVGDLEVNWMYMSVCRAGRRIDLSLKEYSLLAYLMRNAGRPVTRAMIGENVWGLGHDPRSNLVDVYICYLRGKLDAGFDKKLIHTVRGVGYRLGEEGDRPQPPFDAANSLPPAKGPRPKGRAGATEG